MFCMTKKTIYIDESGNFGSDGRYFVISGVVFDEENKKNEIKNIYKKIGQAKKHNLNKVADNGELKAASLTYAARRKLLESMSLGNFDINYIALDLWHMYGYLSENQNVFYNYLTKFIIKPIVQNDSELNELSIILDMRNASVKRSKNFDDYIKSLIWGDWGFNEVKVNVEYLESQNSVGLQCADYIANAIYLYYEKEKDIVNCMRPLIRVRQRFPYKTFGN